MVVTRVLNLARRVRGALRAPQPVSAQPDPVHLANARVEEMRVSLVDGLIEQAGAARDAKDHRGAALLYAAALRVQPDHFGLQVQAGHMFKESGDLATAEGHYLAALALEPQDADLALQLGHFYKVAGQLEQAEASYARALELAPAWNDPAQELARMQSRTRAPDPVFPDAAVDFDQLAPELFPRREHELRRTYVDAVHIHRLGARRERTRWGVMNTLRGVESIRGYAISASPITEFTIAFNGEVVHRGPLVGRAIPESGGRDKYVFHVWLDFSRFAPGPYQVDMSFEKAEGPAQAHREYVVVAPALREADFPDSDTLVNVEAQTPEALEAEINARPSMVRNATRSVLRTPIRNILVMRTDQLGDLVISIPAVRRLRELFPQARIVGLLTDGNADLAATLDIFDETIVIDFPDDRRERKRLMDAAAQEALRERLERYAFDVAIDLAEAGVSRPLMLLTGAKFLYGYYDRDWPFLDAGFEGVTHDPRNYREVASQSAKTVALIERLGATLTGHARVLRRPELTRARLGAYGLSETDRFVVLHTGARIVFSRWRDYPRLAEMILAQTGLKVVMMADDPAFRAALPPALAASDRVIMLDRRLAFDDFDAFLSFCEVFVGNDTGPKHLAALRGAKTVSLHSSRVNWSEWGQELQGSIISRKLPCAGCAVHHDEDECGKDFVCITQIRPEEVFEEVLRQL